MPDVCRFCLSDDNEKSNPFLSPCNCIGSVRFVHRECLNHWRLVTPDQDQKIRCQLCHANYNLPRRWLEEVIPIPGRLWNNVLSQSTIIIALVHYLHLLTITQFSETRSIPQDPHLAAFMLHNKFGIMSFNLIIATATIIYSLYYAQLINKIINRRLYLYYGAIDIARFLASLGICLYITQYTIFPCGGIYIYLLSTYRSTHVLILQKINANGVY